MQMVNVRSVTASLAEADRYACTAGKRGAGESTLMRSLGNELLREWRSYEQLIEDASLL